MDRAIVLDRLGLSNQDWGPGVSAPTHAEFEEGWRGTVTCPTEPEMDAEWAEVEAEGGIASIHEKKNKADAKNIYQSGSAISRAIVSLADSTRRALNKINNQCIEIRVQAWNPPSLTVGGVGQTTSISFNVAGILSTDFVEVSAPYDLQGVGVQGYVSLAAVGATPGTVTVVLRNASGVAVDLGLGNWTVVVLRYVKTPPYTKEEMGVILGDLIDAPNTPD